jgi:septal ring factor EnvC (AmiA/AmiB activator)
VGLAVDTERVRSVTVGEGASGVEGLPGVGEELAVSILSKIFVVLNLVLAIAFATFAVTLYSKRVHYYEQKINAEKALNAQIETLKAEKKVVEENLGKMTQERDQLNTDKTTLKGEVATVRSQLKVSEIEKADALQKSGVATENLNTMTKQVENMRLELADTRKVVVALKDRETVLRANEAELKKERDSLKNDVSRSRQDLAELHRDRKRIAEELGNADYVIRTMITKGYDVYTIVGSTALGPVPDVRTKVVDVRPHTGHVALGAGKASGVKEGHLFLVYRDKEYLGKVRVVTVWDTFSGGTIIERKQPIKAGDEAMTDRNPSP